jgi:hypothetical protein
MSVLMEVLAELWSMFVGDRRLTLLALGVVVLTGLIAAFAHSRLAPAVLLVGAILVLADAVFGAARKARGL